MDTGATLILFGGMIHFGILLASALVPQVLNWRAELALLGRLTRQLVWVHGAFIVLVIVGFWSNELDLRGALVFTAIFISTPFIVGVFALSGYISVIVIVILDIILILKIFGGDVRIR